jgi:hypothetical protein
MWERTVIMKTSKLKILADLHVCSPSEYQVAVAGTPSVWLYTYMQRTVLRLASVWTVARILFIFRSTQEFSHPRFVPGESERSSSKNTGPKT